MESTENIKRFKKAIDSGRFTMTEELEMTKILVTKYKFISKAEYAKINKISPQGVEARLRANNDPYLKMIGKHFIIQF